MNNLSIGFWIKDSGNMMSHGEGLTQEQIEQFKSLKAGDRLILWKDTEPEAQRPNFKLKVYQKKGI